MPSQLTSPNYIQSHDVFVFLIEEAILKVLRAFLDKGFLEEHCASLAIKAIVIAWSVSNPSLFGALLSKKSSSQKWRNLAPVKALRRGVSPGQRTLKRIQLMNKLRLEV